MTKHKFVRELRSALQCGMRNARVVSMRTEFPRIGSCVGPYVIRMQIGSGAMGVVFEAATPDGSHVALKMLHADQLAQPLAVRRFHNEAVAGLAVTHPNVVSTLARGVTSNGIPFLVMERARGEMLTVRVRRGVPSLRRSAAIVRQILAGLEALHAAGVVHGDVKSDNVLVETRDDGGDVARLIDLGLAHIQDDDARRAEVSGTPEYMAPEVVDGFGSSVASDLYAVGIVLYELITGSTPFAGGSTREVMRRHRSEPVVPPSLRQPTVPLILDRIIMRALAKDPSLRFPHARAFASALLVAMLLLDDAETRETPAFSRDAPTIDWVTRGTRRAMEPFRIARGTPGRSAARGR